MKRLAVVGLLALPLLLSGAGGSLSQGQALEMTFTATPSSSDVLLLFHNDPLTVSDSPVITTELYDGATLIASTSNPPELSGEALRYVAVFRSPTATYNGWLGGRAGQTAIADLTFLSTGTNRGRIRVTVAGGSISGFDIEGFRLQDARSFVYPYTPGSNVTRGAIWIVAPVVIPAISIRSLALLAAALTAAAVATIKMWPVFASR